ncbi:MAG: hypothetical protein LBR25_10205 [Erysipelotrichaceae bacterium]|nr:hypothetical protein [Erysipelotrichaceae bacterium]
MEIKTQEILFDEAYLNSRLERYAGYRGFVAYKKDFELIVANAGALLELFRRPYLRENGAELKDKLVKLVQLALVTSIDDHCEKVGDLLNDFFGFMLESLENADYSEIEYFFAKRITDIHTFRDDRAATDKAKRIMAYYFAKYDVLIRKRLNKNDNLSELIKTQRQISRSLQYLKTLLKERSFDEFIFNSSYSTLSRQLFIDELVYTYNMVPVGLFEQNSTKAAEIEAALGKYPKPDQVLPVIDKFNLPIQVSCLYLEAYCLRAYLKGVIADAANPVQYRIYALWLLHVAFQEYVDIASSFIVNYPRLKPWASGVPGDRLSAGLA